MGELNLSHTEENYLKAIFKIFEISKKAASTNAISKEMQTSAASVTDMLKRLSEKKLIHYEKYKGVRLSDEGKIVATELVRKHRLWEVFLVEKLHFSWDEVHDIAEELEHINSELLIERLDDYLGRPKFDPHGDPIPDAEGKFTYRKQILLSEAEAKAAGVIIGVQEHSAPFLQYLDQLGIALGTHVEVKEKYQYDDSIKIIIDRKREIILTRKVVQNLFIEAL